jgi:phage-related protein
VFEIALPFRGDAFRVVYALQLAEEMWVVDAFQKKSTQGRLMAKRKSKRTRPYRGEFS